MICAIVPAAGRSSRMGTEKQLLPWRNTTVIGHVVDQLCQSTLDEIYVVVGHEAERVAAELAGRTQYGSAAVSAAPCGPDACVAGRRVHLVTNPDYHRGMLSSVRCGLRALPSACETIMVVPGDQPAVTAGLVDSLIVAFRAAGKGILVPVHAGKRGHPLLVSARYCQEILTQYDDVGLRGLLYAHRDETSEFAVSTAAVLCDVDNPEDYRRELARWQEHPDTRP